MNDDDNDDAFTWLEEVDSDRALAWVRARNAEAEALLTARPEYAPLRATLKTQLDDARRIPAVARRGAWLYNLWQDEHHPRGLWRRTTLDDYRTAEPQWQTLLDLDALSAAEGEHWVWAGAAVLGPEYRRAMIALSRGGADACVQREFDLDARAFVAGGFELAEAKSELAWQDADTLYVATDFGPGSLTDSGYPRIVKRWRRGTALADAQTVFEARPEHIWAAIHVDTTPGFERTTFERATDFFHHETYLLDAQDQLVALDIPTDSTLTFWRDALLLQIRSDWQPGATRYPAGSLLAADAAAYLRGEPWLTSQRASTSRVSSRLALRRPMPRRSASRSASVVGCCRASSVIQAVMALSGRRGMGAVLGEPRVWCASRGRGSRKARPLWVS
ncbi:MAG TPA: hypothetical protein PL196_09615, partial [Burkholderiaceae bacterium]|nr:hypothetical protein [Burkholderiaceae bacterium]